MKSIDKYKRESEVKVSKKSDIETKKEFSPTDKAKMITECIKQAGVCFESVMSYLSEREKTKQKEMDTYGRIVVSNNSLEEVREKEITKRLEIYSKTLIEIEKINNVKDKIKLFKGCIHQVITTMNEFKLLYNETGDRGLIDMIHEQNLRLLDVSKTINMLQ